MPVDPLRSFAETEAAMDALLLARFPPGSDPAALRWALARDGFAVVGTEATRIVDPWMCRLEWDVTWTEEAGALGPVDASLGGACM
jgi:hypothetical protein